MTGPVGKVFAVVVAADKTERFRFERMVFREEDWDRDGDGDRVLGLALQKAIEGQTVILSKQPRGEEATESFRLVVAKK
jgi:hypothetical protein